MFDDKLPPTDSVDPAATQPLPLAGMRVVEFSHAVMGPSCGLILADLGADVIRIEPPAGDSTRSLPGFGAGYYTFFNRNKRSFAVDLKSAEGVRLVMRLLASTDVVVENFGPGTMDRLGFGYEQVQAQQPRIIYCSLKGFLPGPYAQRHAMDEVVQMMGGLAYMTGPKGQPLRAGSSVVDITGGMFGVIGILAALVERQQTGRGRLVHAALFETTAFLMGQHMAYGAMSGKPVPPMPERVSAWSVYRNFKSRDDKLVFVGIISDRHWQRFCAAFQRDDWAEDEALKTNAQRIALRDRLLPQVEALLAGLDAADIVDRCVGATIPCALVATPEDLWSDPHLLATDALASTHLPGGGVVPLPKLPFTLDERNLGLRNQPPAIGDATLELLAEMGIPGPDLERLIGENIIAGGKRQLVGERDRSANSPARKNLGKENGNDVHSH